MVNMRGFVTIILVVLFCVVSSPVCRADSEEAQYNVVVRLYNAGQWQAALKKIKEREAGNLTKEMRARYAYARALAFEKGKQTEQAKAAYRTVIEKHGKSPEAGKAWLALIYTEYATGNHKVVVELCNKVSTKGLSKEEKRDLALMRAESLYAANDLGGALPGYREALQLGADRNTVLPKLFAIYLKQKNNVELLKVSDKGIPGVENDLLAVIRAEAMLALGQNPQALAEARKVQKNSSWYPRACYASAQALVAKGDYKQAQQPLSVAVESLKDPPAPPGAALTLAECCLANDKPSEAIAALDKCDSAARSLPDQARADLETQSALLRIQACNKLGDTEALLKAVEKSRSMIPAEDLPEILYMRVFALYKANRHDEVLAAVREDADILNKSAHKGDITFIQYEITKKRKPSVAYALLEEFAADNPADPRTAIALVELGNRLLDQKKYEKAAETLGRVLKLPNARKQLEKNKWNEVTYNNALALTKLCRYDQSIPALEALVAAKPSPEIMSAALALLGEASMLKEDHSRAAGAWRRLLATVPPEKKQEVRINLARSLYASGDYKGAAGEFSQLKKDSSKTKLDVQDAELFAHALFETGEFARAASMYAMVYETDSSNADTAYECAVCHVRSGKWKEAVEWFRKAESGKANLDKTYTGNLSANLAEAEFNAGSGTMGLDYWLSMTCPGKDQGAFETGLSRLSAIIESGRSNNVSSAIEPVMKKYPPDNSRYYSLGAMMLKSVSNDSARLNTLSFELAKSFTENEERLKEGTFGATVAPAIIYYIRGESERMQERFADALVSYETVLAVYPYNEWPDAAACGAAECYAALGENETALKKFNEIIKTGSKTSASGKWIQLARKRAEELKTRK